MDRGVSRFIIPRSVAVAATALTLSACAGHHYKPVSDYPVKIGRPYTVRGITYTPHADPTYDVLGYASWYGAESGHQTANGERFQAKWVTAAHKTLPLPSYVAVTNLDSGKTILVRVNDRGPFARGRILDLSRGAAEELGILRSGIAPVRVRIVHPSKKDRERLMHGKEASPQPYVPTSVLDNLRAQLATGVAEGLVQAP